MKLYSMFIILIIFMACGRDRTIHSFAVTKYLEVDEGYQYSKDLLKYKDDTYKPLVSSDYINDTLKSATVFKVEGKIRYSKEKIQADPLFKETLNLPEMRKIILLDNEVEDNGRRYPIAERRSDSVFCKQSDTLLLYELH